MTYTFETTFNEMNEAIKFTMETSTKSLPFLDILLSIQDKKIVSDIYYKATDSKRYVPFHSNHPSHIKKNIPFTLARRIRLLVDDNTTEEKCLRELEEELLQQDYPFNLIKQGINKAKTLDKNAIRNPIENEEQQQDIIPMITTYNPNNAAISNFIRINYHTLQNNQETKEIFKDTRLILAKRQPKNLSKFLCKAQFEHKHATVTKCDKPRCKLCTQIITGDSYRFECGTLFKVKTNMTCDSKNVLYQLVCNGCNKTYIGETVNLRLRMNVHRDQIKNPNNCTLGVSKHIASCTRNKSIKFLVFPFYQVYGDDMDRIQKEQFFINKFQPSLNKL